jgi:hypothetical protein
MLSIDVEADLNAVNAQIGSLVEELNKINASRETLVQQLQNLSGVAMYLRGKAPVEEGASDITDEVTPDNSFERTDEYPEESKESD